MFLIFLYKCTVDATAVQLVASAELVLTHDISSVIWLCSYVIILLCMQNTFLSTKNIFFQVRHAYPRIQIIALILHLTFMHF